MAANKKRCERKIDYRLEKAGEENKRGQKGKQTKKEASIHMIVGHQEWQLVLDSMFSQIRLLI